MRRSALRCVPSPTLAFRREVGVVTRAGVRSGRGLAGMARRVGGLLLAIVAAEDLRLRGIIACAAQAGSAERRARSARRQSLLQTITNARAG